MKIAQAHSEEDKRDELRLMLRRGQGMTLATLMRLVLADSALVRGGRYDAEEARKTSPILGGGVKKWAQAAAELDAAFRAMEIIIPSKDAAAKNNIEAFSPEWMAGIVAVASTAANADAEAVIHRYPLALVFHLVAAEHRRNGGITRRPLAADDVLSALAEAKNGRQGN